MLKGKNIDFSYSKDKDFIKNLNIEIPKGKVTTILGPNGSGKSTLLSILSCFNKPQNGDVYLDDMKLNKLKYKEVNVIDMQNINWIKKGISFLQAKFLGKKYEKSF